jgi:hypothetical protein
MASPRITGTTLAPSSRSRDTMDHEPPAAAQPRNDGQMTRFQEKRNLLWIGLAIFILSICVVDYLPNGIFEDDAYFYFQIAKEILDSGRSTFDGISTTNGYHPLWMAILVAAAAPLKLLGIDSPLPYAACFIAAGCAVWLMALSHLKGSAVLLGATLSLYCGLAMETPLAALFLILAFDRIIKGEPATTWVYLMVATRIDMAIILLPLLFLRSVKDKGRIIFAALLAEGSVAIFNWVVSGHPYSISSAIKSGYAAMGPMAVAADNLSSVGNLYRYAVTVALDIAILYFLRQAAPPRAEQRALWFGLVMAANLFLLAHTFLSSTRHWYFAPALLPLLYLWSRLQPEGHGGQPPRRKMTIASASLAAMAGIGLLLFTGYLANNLADSRASKRFFEHVRQAVPPGSIIFAADGAGYAAWMLNGYAQVVDGDGLVNSFEYFYKTRRACDMRSYFNKNDVRYYLLDTVGQDNCPIECYCMQEGQYRPVAASTSRRNYVRYRLFAMQPG